MKKCISNQLQCCLTSCKFGHKRFAAFLNPASWYYTYHYVHNTCIGLQLWTAYGHAKLAQEWWTTPLTLLPLTSPDFKKKKANVSPAIVLSFHACGLQCNPRSRREFPYWTSKPRNRKQWTIAYSELRFSCMQARHTHGVYTMPRVHQQSFVTTRYLQG